MGGLERNGWGKGLEVDGESETEEERQRQRGREGEKERRITRDRVCPKINREGGGREGDGGEGK